MAGKRSHLTACPKIMLLARQEVESAPTACVEVQYCLLIGRVDRYDHPLALRLPLKDKLQRLAEQFTVASRTKC